MNWGRDEGDIDAGAMPAMLRVVRDRATAAGLENLDCVQAGFLSYQHAGAPIDAIHTRNAFHHLPDFWKGLALVRMAAIIRTGGVLRLHDIIYDFKPIEAETVLAGWLDGASADPARGYTREDFATHIRNEYGTFRWLIEPMFVSGGFKVENAGFRGSADRAYTCLR